MRKIPKMVVDGINPCGNHICLCIEYLDFGKEKDRQRYKHCYITSENNSKYESPGPGGVISPEEYPPVYHQYFGSVNIPK